MIFFVNFTHQTVENCISLARGRYEVAWKVNPGGETISFRYTLDLQPGWWFAFGQSGSNVMLRMIGAAPVVLSHAKDGKIALRHYFISAKTTCQRGEGACENESPVGVQWAMVERGIVSAHFTWLIDDLGTMPLGNRPLQRGLVPIIWAVGPLKNDTDPDIPNNINYHKFHISKRFLVDLWRKPIWSCSKTDRSGTITDFESVEETTTTTTTMKPSGFSSAPRGVSDLTNQNQPVHAPIAAFINKVNPNLVINHPFHTRYKINNSYYQHQHQNQKQQQVNPPLGLIAKSTKLGRRLTSTARNAEKIKVTAFDGSKSLSLISKTFRTELPTTTTAASTSTTMADTVPVKTTLNWEVEFLRKLAQFSKGNRKLQIYPQRVPIRRTTPKIVRATAGVRMVPTTVIRKLVPTKQTTRTTSTTTAPTTTTSTTTVPTTTTSTTTVPTTTTSTTTVPTTTTSTTTVPTTTTSTTTSTPTTSTTTKPTTTTRTTTALTTPSTTVTTTTMSVTLPETTVAEANNSSQTGVTSNVEILRRLFSILVSNTKNQMISTVNRSQPVEEDENESSKETTVTEKQVEHTSTQATRKDKEEVTTKDKITEPVELVPISKDETLLESTSSSTNIPNKTTPSTKIHSPETTANNQRELLKTNEFTTGNRKSEVVSEVPKEFHSVWTTYAGTATSDKTMRFTGTVPSSSKTLSTTMEPKTVTTQPVSSTTVKLVSTTVDKRKQSTSTTSTMSTIPSTSSTTVSSTTEVFSTESENQDESMENETSEPAGAGESSEEISEKVMHQWPYMPYELNKMGDSSEVDENEMDMDVDEEDESVTTTVKPKESIQVDEYDEYASDWESAFMRKMQEHAKGKNEGEAKNGTRIGYPFWKWIILPAIHQLQELGLAKMTGNEVEVLPVTNATTIAPTSIADTTVVPGSTLDVTKPKLSETHVILEKTSTTSSTTSQKPSTSTVPNTTSSTTASTTTTKTTTSSTTTPSTTTSSTTTTTPTSSTTPSTTSSTTTTTTTTTPSTTTSTTTTPSTTTSSTTTPSTTTSTTTTPSTSTSTTTTTSTSTTTTSTSTTSSTTTPITTTSTTTKPTTKPTTTSTTPITTSTTVTTTVPTTGAPTTSDLPTHTSAGDKGSSTEPVTPSEAPIVQGPDLQERPYFGTYIGELEIGPYEMGSGSGGVQMRRRRSSVSGSVYAPTSTTIAIVGFKIIGFQPGSYFMVSKVTRYPQMGVDSEMLPDELGRYAMLNTYNLDDSDHILLKLPKGITTSNMKWLSVWNRVLDADLGSVLVPTNFQPPTSVVLGMFKSPNDTVTGLVTAVNSRTIRIDNFQMHEIEYPVWLWTGTGEKPSGLGYPLPHAYYNFHEPADWPVRPLKINGSKVIYVYLPRSAPSLQYATYLSIFSLQDEVNHGHVIINAEARAKLPSGDALANTNRLFPPIYVSFFCINPKHNVTLH